MKTSMRYTQLETGLSKPYYTYNYYSAYFLATPTWNTHIWQYCSESHVKLKEATPWLYQGPRKNNFHLMDVILRSTVTQKQKEIFNRVRLHLRLLTASDIVYAHKSTKIHDDILIGINRRKSVFNWPSKFDLPKEWFEIFRIILQQVIMSQLQSTPLGAWENEGHQRFGWYGNKNNGTVLSVDDYSVLEEDDRDSYETIEYDETNKKVLGCKHVTQKEIVEDDENIETVIRNSPTWMKNLWRGNTFSPEMLQKIIDKLENNKLCIVGDGTVRDQLGSYAWCMATKGEEAPFIKAHGPVDGHRHHMRALRAESTHVLASIALITRLEKFVSKSHIHVQVYTDCKTLINRVMTDNINSPSLVMADHVDLIHQIRKVIKNSDINFELEYTQTIKNDDFDMATWNEKLVQSMHVDAYIYFTTKEAIIPRKYSDYLGASKISLVANNKPLVSDIGMSIQTLEKRAIREDYIRDRMKIHESMVDNVYMYTLGRVISKTQNRHCIYSKIIHKELNTMSVNEKWSGTSDRCPVCLNAREDWMHPLVCQHKDLMRKRDELLIEFENRLTEFKTYPPLQYFILNFFRNLYRNRIPHPPTTTDPKYIIEFNDAYENQTTLGWDNFCRGIISRHWKFLQHCNILEKKTKDVHAVDKWTQMLIKSILEYNRLIWKERCEILHMKNEFTYQNRQREIIWQFCIHLRRNKHLVPQRDRHFLWKPYSFFSKGNYDGVVNWESGMKLSLIVFKEKNVNDIRKYMVEKNGKRKDHTARDNADHDTQERHKAKRMKQTDIATYCDVPGSQPMTPRPIRRKRTRESNNQLTIDDMNKRRQLTIENEKHVINEIVDVSDTENLKRKYDVHLGSRKCSRTNISIFEIRKGVPRGTMLENFKTLHGSG